MLERTVDWFRRSRFPDGAHAPLGWGAEYWDADATHYEGWEELRDRYAALGRKRTKRELAFDLSGNLVDDVLAAAGGIEHAIVALRSTIAELQEYCEVHTVAATPGIPHGVGHAAATDAWYEFANVLSWARALEERLDRSAINKKLPRQGLLPALKPVRLKKRVQTSADRLRHGPVGETRLLANFTLHAALVRGPFSGAAVDEAGIVHLPIPDAPVKPVTHWYLLRWDQGRDGITFADELWRSVEDFIDELLDAFERAVPRRLRKSNNT